MSLRKLNKITFAEPEKETLEEHTGPSKTLEETIEICRNIKLNLREIEHYIERNANPEEEDGGKHHQHHHQQQQLGSQLMKTKREIVRLELLLIKEFEREVGKGDVGDDDVFADDDEEEEEEEEEEG